MEPSAAVAAALALAGLEPSAEEVAIMVEQYEAFRAGVESLRAVPALRYETPGTTFNAAPRFAAWGEPL